MVPDSIKAFLERHAVDYRTLVHSPAFAATDVAAAVAVPARNFAKTVVVKIDGLPAMLVIPATRRILIHELRDMLDCPDVVFATESELNRWFPECETGAMPPFGPLYGMAVYVSADVARQPEIAFNAGTHSDVIRMSYEDFEHLVQPRHIDLVTT